MKERFQWCECISDEPQWNPIRNPWKHQNERKISGKFEVGIRIGITWFIMILVNYNTACLAMIFVGHNLRMQLNVLKNPKLWIIIYCFFQHLDFLKAVNCKAKFLPRNQVLKMDLRLLIPFSTALQETLFTIWTLWLFGVLKSRMKPIFKSWFLGITWLWLLWVKLICLLYIFSSFNFLFQETDGTQIGSAKTAKDALLLWCQMKTAGYHNVNIRNFTTR